MKYFPNIPEDVLRREWQHFRHLEPDYNKWLKFMHEERSRGNGDLMGAKPMLRIVLAALGIGGAAVLAILAALIKAAL